MRANLDSLSITNGLGWGDYRQIAVDLGYTGKKLESNVEYMCKVWERVQGRAYGNGPKFWEDTHPRKRHE